MKNKKGLKVFSKACPLFVLLAENNLILGCTRYPLMTGLIAKIVGPWISIIKSAKEVAAVVESILASDGMRNPLVKARPSYRFFVSGSTESFEDIGERLFKKKIKAYQIKL